MLYFQTKNIHLSKFWRALEWKMLVYFMAVWNILRPLGIFYISFVTLWYFGTSFWYIVSREIWQPCLQSSSGVIKLKAN
jgi:hypothetical protein